MGAFGAIWDLPLRLGNSWTYKSVYRLNRDGFQLLESGDQWKLDKPMTFLKFPARLGSQGQEELEAKGSID